MIAQRCRLVVLVFGIAVALLDGGCSGAPRRERVVDLVAAVDSAEPTLEPGAREIVIFGDNLINTDDDRIELAMSAGTTLRYRGVAIHANARLSYALGPPKTKPDGSRAPLRCTVAFEQDDGTRTELLDVTVEPGEGGRRHEGMIDLSALAGTRGALVLATEGAHGGRARVSWSRLRLESDGRPQTAADRVISLLELQSNLADQVAASSQDSGSIDLPVPGSAELRVAIPPGARLRFFPVAFRKETAAAAPGEAASAGSVRFRVRADDRVVRELTCEIDRTTPNAFDHQEDVDLSGFAGHEVVLRFEAEPAGDALAGPVTASFALPRLLARREVARAKRARGSRDLFLVVIDTLRADALGCYGAARPTSPNLDAFARQSLVYARAYSPSSWTLPSTVSLLTGLHPDVHGARDAASTFLLDAHETLAERLSAAGVTTGGFVANALLSPSGNFDQGFESWQVLPWVNARKLVPRALGWLDEHEDDRVFGYVHFVDPHASYDAPLPAAETFATVGNEFDGQTYRDVQSCFGEDPVKEILERSSSPKVRAAVGRCRDLYDTEVRYFDRWFGAFLAGLRARGRLDDAVVIVTADHGEEFLDHGAIFHGDHVYDETVRVPLIVHAPGLTPGRISEPFATKDVMRLALDLLDAGDPGAADVRVRAHFPESIVMVTDIAYEPSIAKEVSREALVRGRYKLAVTPELGREELYDLETDPGELHDLAQEQPRIRAALSEQLRRQREEYARSALREKVPVIPEIEARMRALGYIR